MHRFGWSNADENSKDLHTRRTLRHRRVKTVAALLNRWEMEPRGVRNGLQKVRIRCVVIRSRNCCMLANRQAWYCLRKREIRIEIRIVVAAAVTCPPARIQR